MRFDRRTQPGSDHLELGANFGGRRVGHLSGEKQRATPAISGDESNARHLKIAETCGLGRPGMESLREERTRLGPFGAGLRQ